METYQSLENFEQKLRYLYLKKFAVHFKFIRSDDLVTMNLIVSIYFLLSVYLCNFESTKSNYQTVLGLFYLLDSYALVSLVFLVFYCMETHFFHFF